MITSKSLFYIHLCTYACYELKTMQISIIKILADLIVKCIDSTHSVTFGKIINYKA